MSDKQGDEDLKAIIRVVAHHLFMMFMAVIIVFAIGYAYMIIKNINAKDIVPMQSSSSKGMAHPFPDFIIDKVKLDELGQLKP